MKILLVGPDPTRSKGGMASVIQTILDDEQLNKDFTIDMYGACVQGNIIKRVLFSVCAFLVFCLKMGGYDVYHIHVAGNGSTFRKAMYLQQIKRWRKKVILHIHGNDYMGFYNALSARQKARVRAMFHQADTVIALSQGWKNSFDNALETKNCIVIENCVNTEWYARAVTDPDNRQNIFVALGILGKRKGTYDLIEAVGLAKDRVPEIYVYIAGNGEIEQARQMIKEKRLEKNIELTGWVDSEGKIDLLKRAATMVLPSYHEGLPMAILEAMACGKAIISTTVGAIPEVVHDENGILIQPGDIHALADAMVECATNADRMKRMSECNMEKIEQQYSMRNMQEKLSTCYRNLQ